MHGLMGEHAHAAFAADVKESDEGDEALAVAEEPDATEDTDPAEVAEIIADILGGLLGEDALLAFTEEADVKESAEWDESAHKRADDGKFGSGGGGGTAKHDEWSKIPKEHHETLKAKLSAAVKDVGKGGDAGAKAKATIDRFKAMSDASGVDHGKILADFGHGGAPAPVDWRNHPVISTIRKEANERDLNDSMRELQGVHIDDLKIHPDVAKQFDGHGVETLERLAALLHGGVDKGRTFYSEQLGAVQEHSLLKDTGSFVVLGHPGKSISNGGIAGVLVDPLHTPNIPELRKLFPHVKFVAAKDAAATLAKVAPRGGKAVKDNAGVRESAEWDESAHKRAEDGKFGSGGGNKKKPPKGAAEFHAAVKGSEADRERHGRSMMLEKAKNLLALASHLGVSTDGVVEDNMVKKSELVDRLVKHAHAKAGHVSAEAKPVAKSAGPPQDFIDHARAELKKAQEIHGFGIALTGNHLFPRLKKAFPDLTPEQFNQHMADMHNDGIITMRRWGLEPFQGRPFLVPGEKLGIRPDRDGIVDWYSGIEKFNDPADVKESRQFDLARRRDVTLLEAWNSIDHPRGKGGRFIPKGSPEAHAAAKVALATLKTQEATPENTRTALEHLSILTVKQLHQLRKEHGLKASGKLRAQLVAAIAERLPGAGHKPEAEKVPEPAKVKGPHEMTAKEALQSGLDFQTYKHAVIDAFRNETTAEDDPIYRKLHSISPDDYTRAQRLMGKEVEAQGRIATLTDVASDLSTVTVTHEDGKTSLHKMSDLTSVTGLIDRAVEDAKDGSLNPGRAMQIAPYLAKEIVEKNGNLFAALKEKGVDPMSRGGRVLRDAVAKSIEEVKAKRDEPSPARQKAIDRQKELQADSAAPSPATPAAAVPLTPRGEGAKRAPYPYGADADDSAILPVPAVTSPPKVKPAVANRPAYPYGVDDQSDLTDPTRYMSSMLAAPPGQFPHVDRATHRDLSVMKSLLYRLAADDINAVTAQYKGGKLSPEMQKQRERDTNRAFERTIRKLASGGFQKSHGDAMALASAVDGMKSGSFEDRDWSAFLPKMQATAAKWIKEKDHPDDFGYVQFLLKGQLESKAATTVAGAHPLLESRPAFRLTPRRVPSIPLTPRRSGS